MRLTEALGAVEIDVDDDQLAGIETALSAADIIGDRYPAAQMAVLDSER